MRGTRPAFTIDTFLARKVEVSDGGCWNARGASKHHGYTQVSIKNKRFAAHRWVYEQLVGPIPEGLTIDHLCRNTRCVNPEHLEPVTLQENLRRTRATVCESGHDLTAEGSRYDGGACKQCVLSRALRRVSCVACRLEMAYSNLRRHLRTHEKEVPE